MLLLELGACTALFAASTGLLQNDLKRVIAYSTCSQIGYLFIACGLSQYEVAIFHLVNHAFFKALLFLAAGAVLHAVYDQQDIRRLGGLLGFIPFTYTAILIGSLSLIAVPFITGFYSKDLILELAYAQYEFKSNIAYWLGTISASLTAFYSIRLISITFLTYANANKIVYNNAHDPSIIVIIPLVILSFISIAFGYLASDLYVGIASDFLSNSLFVYPSHISIIEAHYSIPIVMKMLPIIVTIIASVFAIYLYHIVPNYLINITNNKIGYNLYKFFNGKYLVDNIYNYYIIYGGLNIGNIISLKIDLGLIELLGPYGLSTSLQSSSKTISLIDTGSVQNYALYIIVATVSIIFIVFTQVIFNYSIIISLVFIVTIISILITILLK